MLGSRSPGNRQLGHNWPTLYWYRHHDTWPSGISAGRPLARLVRAHGSTSVGPLSGALRPRRRVLSRYTAEIPAEKGPQARAEGPRGPRRAGLRGRGPARVLADPRSQSAGPLGALRLSLSSPKGRSPGSPLLRRSEFRAMAILVAAALLGQPPDPGSQLSRAHRIAGRHIASGFDGLRSGGAPTRRGNRLPTRRRRCEATFRVHPCPSRPLANPGYIEPAESAANLTRRRPAAQ